MIISENRKSISKPIIAPYHPKTLYVSVAYPPFVGAPSSGLHGLFLISTASSRCRSPREFGGISVDFRSSAQRSGNVSLRVVSRAGSKIHNVPNFFPSRFSQASSWNSGGSGSAPRPMRLSATGGLIAIRDCPAECCTRASASSFLAQSEASRGTAIAEKPALTGIPR